MRILKTGQRIGKFFVALSAVLFFMAFFLPTAEFAREPECVCVLNNSPELPQDQAEQSITISALGDCALGAEYGQQGVTFHTVFALNNGDYSYFFSGVHPVLSEDDLTIANLETSLTKAWNRIDKSYLKYAFWIKGEPEYARILTEGSVEAVSVANNHTYDYREEGFLETLISLKTAGVDYFGFDQVLIKEIKGIKIGLLGFTEFNVGGRWRSYSDMKTLVHSAIQALAPGTDLIIVSFHWGNEKEIKPTATQRELAHLAIEAGADLVLGHHPHVLQGMEEYQGKQIVYSLGNFCFGANRVPYDRDTLIYQQTFTFQEGILTGTSMKLIPCSMTTAPTGNDFRPTLLEGAEAERVLLKIEERIRLISQDHQNDQDQEIGQDYQNDPDHEIDQDKQNDLS